jgi:hypothetical protein
MNRDQVVRALDEAFSAHVGWLFHELCAGGESPDARTKFEDGVRSAQRAHDETLDKFGGAAGTDHLIETDDDFRARMLPIAGNDQKRDVLNAGTGAELDRLGQHYNVERGRSLPAVRPLITPARMPEPALRPALVRDGSIGERARPSFGDGTIEQAAEHDAEARRELIDAV